MQDSNYPLTLNRHFIFDRAEKRFFFAISKQIVVKEEWKTAKDVSSLTHCILGNFLCFLNKFFQKYHQNVKRFGP